MIVLVCLLRVCCFTFRWCNVFRVLNVVCRLLFGCVDWFVNSVVIVYTA